jgi:hypothetical protein
MAGNGIFNMINNYIYLYHVDQFIVIPTFPESITDTLSVNFNRATPMSRSAPIYSYSDSGPRSLQINLDLHRDMMTQINYGVSNANVELGDDYVDTLIKQIQAVALPSYGSSKKMVDPPMVAVRFGNDVFIKGVVTGAVSVTYALPLIEGNKYAHVSVSFTVEEVDPYDARTVMEAGSFRGLDSSLERNNWRINRLEHKV